MANKEGEKEKRLSRVAIRSRERALQEERLGLAAVAKAFVLECPDPGRLLARLEAMVRAATQPEANVPIRVRQSLIDGTLLIRNAVNRELGRPQELLDPPGWNHVRPEAVERVAGIENIPQQLGLVEGSGDLGDVIRSHEEQVKIITSAHEYVVRAFKQGPATDVELYDRYMAMREAPRQSPGAVKERRKELTVSGRVVAAKAKRERMTVWCLVEDTTDLEGLKDWGNEGHQEERVPCPECGESFGKGAGLAVHRQSKHGLRRPKLVNAPSRAE